jgi:hypothetical protein
LTNRLIDGTSLVLIIFKFARLTNDTIDAFLALDPSPNSEEEEKQQLDADIKRQCEDAIRQRIQEPVGRSSTRLMEKRLREQLKEKSGVHCTARQLYHIMQERSCFISQPITKKEALQGPDADLWKQAIEKEWDVMEQFGVFLAPQERAAAVEKHGANIIFVPAVMPLVTKSIENPDPKQRRRKARLCAAGNRLRDVFGRKIDGNADGLWSAPASLNTFRLVSLLACRPNYSLEICDLDGAYLQSTLPNNRIYYMQVDPNPQPTKWKDKAKAMQAPVLRIIRSLYGLEESGHIWSRHASSVLEKMGYKRCMDTSAVWSEIRTSFRMKETETASVYVGVGINKEDELIFTFDCEN